VRFQDRVVAVVADGVEVQVEALLAGGQAEGPQVLDQAGEQLLAGGAADPVGVGGQVGGLRQGGEAEEERQPGIVGELVDVVDAGDPGRGGQQQGADGVPGRQLGGGRVAGSADQLVQADLGHGRGQQQQPGVVTVKVHRRGRPAVQGGGFDGRQLRGGATGRGVVAAQPRQALAVADLPDGLRGDRGARTGEELGDLGDRPLARAQG
jgi:hypothetical protein